MSDIPDELVERMVNLVRSMTEHIGEHCPGALLGNYPNIYAMACAIAKDLPKPDPDKRAVCEALDGTYYLIPLGDDSDNWRDPYSVAAIALDCLKRGREMERGSK